MSSSPIPWLNDLIQKIEGLDFPAEWKPYVQELNNVMIALAEKAGQAYLAYLTGIVVGINNDTTLTGAQKFQYVVSKATGPALGQPLQALGNDELNAIIQYTVTSLKAKGIIS
jgi:hypothetical protein